jgi:hypothetical protein
MRSSLALSALSLFTSPILAAPLLGSTGAFLGTVKGAAKADVVGQVNGFVDVDLVSKGLIRGDSELKVFVDLLVRPELLGPGSWDFGPGVPLGTRGDHGVVGLMADVQVSVASGARYHAVTDARIVANLAAVSCTAVIDEGG